MQNPQPPWPRLVFLVAFLSVGLPYWPIPYDQVNLPNALYGFGLIVVFLGAMLLRWRVGTPVRRSVLAAGSAVPAAVFARIVVEGIMDPTSHNLWPFEVVIAAGLGYGIAAAGGVAGAVLARLASR